MHNPSEYFKNRYCSDMVAAVYQMLAFDQHELTKKNQCYTMAGAKATL